MEPSGQNGWYIARRGQTYGPYTWDEIATHASGRRIGKGDKILDPRTGAWSKSSQVPGLFGAGGVATAPVGVSTAAKLAAAAILVAVLVMAGVAVMTVPSATPGFLKDVDVVTGVETIVGQDAQKSQSAELPPEGLVYKGTFDYENREGADVENLAYSEPCYLWIYTTEDGTAASFNYGEYYIDGWPVYLKSHSGTSYVFESSDRSLVEEVKITVNASSNGANGRVKNTTPRIGAFVSGTFTASPSTYEQYKADVID